MRAWYNVTVFVEPKLSVETDHNLSTGYATCKEYPSPENNGKEGYNFRGERARDLLRGSNYVNTRPHGQVGFIDAFTIEV